MKSFRHIGERSRVYGVFYESAFRSTGTIENGNLETMYWWTAWRLYEQLLIAALVSFFANVRRSSCHCYSFDVSRLLEAVQRTLGPSFVA